MAGRVTVTECPNCGAPIDPASMRGTTDPKCPFCHTALPVEAEAPAPATFTFTGPTVTTGNLGGEQPSSKGGCVGGIVAIVIAVAVGIGILVAILAATHKTSVLGGSSITPDGKAVPVSPFLANQGFYVLARSTGSSSGASLVRIDPVKHKTVWTGLKLSSDDSNSALIVPGPKVALVIYGSTVVADDAGTGKQLWQASLSNGLASPCDSGCAVVSGNHLVTLSKDGVVQALDLATGAQAWNRRLNSTPRWLETAGQWVVTDDKVGETGPDLAVLVIDPATGAPHQFNPECQPSTNNPTPEAPSEDDGFFVTPDGTGITTLITGSNGCIARYTTADGTLVWRSGPVEDNNPVPFTLTGQSVTQGAGGVVWTNDNSGTEIWTADAATGALRKVSSAGKNTVKLTGVIGHTLIMESAPAYDSSKPAIVAIDLLTSQQRWQVASRVGSGVSEQRVLLSTSSPTIVSCRSSDDLCKLETLNVDTGTIRTSVDQTALPGSADYVSAVQSGNVQVTTVGWQHIVGYDATTGAVLWKWPN